MGISRRVNIRCNSRNRYCCHRAASPMAICSRPRTMDVIISAGIASGMYRLKEFVYLWKVDVRLTATKRQKCARFEMHKTLYCLVARCDESYKFHFCCGQLCPFIFMFVTAKPRDFNFCRSLSQRFDFCRSLSRRFNICRSQ
jgi:hypothetical protein